MNRASAKTTFSDMYKLDFPLRARTALIPTAVISCGVHIKKALVQVSGAAARSYTVGLLQHNVPAYINTYQAPEESR